jgi:magnesium transporter
MPNVLFLPELRELLVEGDDENLREIMTEHHPASVADFSEALSTEETWSLLDRAPLKNQAEVFSFYSPATQDALVRGGDRHRVSQLLEAMPHDDRVDLLRRLPESTVDDLLPLVDKADREDIRRLLSYPEHSAGAIMTTDYATLPLDISVRDALTRIRQQAATRETIYYIYIIDVDRRLIGFVSLRDLILAKPDVLLQDVMTTDVVSVRLDQDQEQIARLMSRYDFLAVPVVDNENHLVGIVTHDDILDVLTEEATEDALRQGAVGPLAEPYLDVNFARAWRTRAIWLSCLFVAELFTFTALASFEGEIAQVLALSLFVPLCISTGGNSGSQAATLITRALALGEITPGQWRRVLRHELLIGIALGVTLGAIGFVRASLTPTSVLGNADRWILAVVIAQSVGAICLWGTIVGSMLPLFFKRLGFDPGYASSPFVATFVDVTGIMIYFSIAKLLLL